MMKRVLTKNVWKDAGAVIDKVVAEEEVLEAEEKVEDPIDNGYN